jgi:hypothetical protein
MSQDDALCLICGQNHATTAIGVAAASCPAMQAAVATGARPTNVPSRVYGGYLGAREAMRANSPRAAVEALRRVLSSIAEERGSRPDESFPTKMAKLCDDGVIEVRVRTALLERALSGDPEVAQAWALMSIAEHAFYRLYLSKGRV